MSINREGLRCALVKSDVRVELCIAGFTHTYEMSMLIGFITLLLDNVSWTTDATQENSLYHAHAIGKLEAPEFYDRDLRDALLPTFLEGDSAKQLLGITQLNFYVTNNDWSYRQQPHGYHEFGGDSISDTFYNARLSLLVGGTQVEFNLANFYGDTRDHGSRDDGFIDTRNRGKLYDAIYLLSVIPDAAWKAIWSTSQNNFSFAGYKFRKGNNGVINVVEDRRIGYGKTDPIIFVNRERVGASDVRLGKLKSQR